MAGALHGDARRKRFGATEARDRAKGCADCQARCKTSDQATAKEYLDSEVMVYPAFFAHSIRMSATSGRLNSIGGRWPALSISRTFVPLGATLCSGPCGQVLLDTTASQGLHQAVCSNFRMVTPISW